MTEQKMSTEQLKMLLDAMQSLGTGGKEAFIWWLAMDKGLPVVGWLITLYAIVAVARLVIRHAANCSRFNEVRAALVMSAYSDPYFVKTCEKLREAGKK